MESDSRRSPGMMGGSGWSLAELGDPSSPPGSLIPVINSTTRREMACSPAITLSSACPLSPYFFPHILSFIRLVSRYFIFSCGIVSNGFLQDFLPHLPCGCRNCIPIFKKTEK
ncbi:hypothetical protein KUCAC02_029196 [Chaenocephalus aceratus]|uniref:Uncharacterized protein n=1 Tax=Chaenocephalus aceratus TaxID=36190 RepID=A0ACB9X645_CHAAC|nr:hypothetical protein KUCAC02_029196 [Chaenocephalus aceratus]